MSDKSNRFGIPENMTTSEFWRQKRAAEVQALDAARYRWLRDRSEPGICSFYLSVGTAFKKIKFTSEQVDIAIDARIAADQNAIAPAPHLDDEPAILAVGVHHTTTGTTVVVTLHQGDRITKLYGLDHPAGRETMGTVQLSPGATTPMQRTAADRFARARQALQQGIDKCAAKYDVTKIDSASTELPKE